MSTTAHVAGEGYSGRNPVPTIEKYQGMNYFVLNASANEVPADQADYQDDKSLPPTPAAQSSKADEKKELMDRLQPPKDSKATDAGKQKGDRWVRDPVTGQDAYIREPEFKGK